MLRFLVVKRVVLLVALSAPLIVVAACTSFGSDDPAPLDSGVEGSSEAAPTADGAVSDVVTAPGNCAVDAPFGPAIPIGGLDGYGVEAVRFASVRSVVYLSLCKPADGTKEGCDMYQGVLTNKADTFGNFAALAVNDSTQYDSYPTVTGDAQWLFFGSTRSGANKAKLYRAQAEGGVFRRATEQATNFEASNEPYLLASGLTFYFAASISLSPKPQWDLYRAVGTVPDFGAPVRIPLLDQPDTDEFAPVPSEDELELFFASSRAPGSTANLDIWHATRAAVSEDFGALEHLAGDLNGSRNDFPTSLSPDHCELYLIRKQPGAGSGVGVAYVARRQRSPAK